MNTKTKTILAGVLIGAATGLAAAMMWNRRAEEEGTTEITAGDGLKLGVMIVGLLRAISSLGEEDEKKRRK
jgi:gas vesicle protein